MLHFLAVYCLALVRDFSKFLSLYLLSLFLWYITPIRSNLPPRPTAYISVEDLAISLAHFTFLSSSRYRSDTKKGK
jgi:hypothetical protein